MWFNLNGQESFLYMTIFSLSNFEALLVGVFQNLKHYVYLRTFEKTS